MNPNCYGLPQQAITALNRVFAAHPNVQQVIIYGSRARGDYRPNSDINFCLIAPSLNWKELLTLENQLDDLLLPWKIDLLLKHKIDNPDLLAQIEQDGKTFYTAS